ncbi:MAG: ABC transporter ATP-binding protein [Leptolyngbya sp. SIO4C5]|nr:ABC transporter ATP-binding protein [Leptolyngbya sp. SIO4C5]
MAPVVLENIYKTFPRHRRDPSAGPEVPAISLVSEAAIATEINSTTAIAVLRRISLTVADGEFMVLVGPSGCGKSTLLRLIAGLETLTAGNVRVGDRLVNQLPPKQRDIAMVFQSYALYPHLTVYDNLAFGLRRMSLATGADSRQQDAVSSAWWESALVALTRVLPKGLRYLSEAERQVDQRVRSVARMLQIEPLLNRMPRQLSGGQKQRVALGRAMSRNPQVFLMDEPLSNLDAKLRTETRAQIVALQRSLGITTIYVTHDQTEAMTMGDRIAVMNQGQIQQVAPPLELYHHPANRFVAEFIGSPPMNFIPVQVKGSPVISHPRFRLTLPGCWEETLRAREGQTVLLGIRPEHLTVGLPAPKNLCVRVMRVEALGNETYITADLAGEQLQARLAGSQPVKIDDELWLAIAAEQIHLFDLETEQAIDPA